MLSNFILIYNGVDFFFQFLWKAEFLSQPISEYWNRTTILIPFYKLLHTSVPLFLQILWRDSWLMTPRMYVYVYKFKSDHRSLAFYGCVFCEIIINESYVEEVLFLIWSRGRGRKKIILVIVRFIIQEEENWLWSGGGGVKGNTWEVQVKYSCLLANGNLSFNFTMIILIKPFDL